MAFRNPLHSLPASALTGQIGSGQIADGAVTGTKLTADAIDGKTITGAVVRAVRPDGTVAAIMAPDAGDGNAGLRAYGPGNATWAEISSGSLAFGAPGLALINPIGIFGSATDAQMDIMSGNLSNTVNQARISLTGESATDPARILITADGNSVQELDCYIEGILHSGNEARGSVTITAGSGANVSATVGGVFILGTKFRIYTTVLSSVPSNITGCTTSNPVFNGVNQLSFTVTLCRQGTATATVVQWYAIGDYS